MLEAFRRYKVAIAFFFSAVLVTGLMSCLLASAYAQEDQQDSETAQTTSDVQTSTESDNQLENSWRYRNGQRIQVTSDDGEGTLVVPLESCEWTKSGSSWYTTLGGSTMSISDAQAFGVDVSKHNGSIDWAAAKAAGVQYAIIRVGYGMDQTDQDDEYAISNIQGCIDNGIDFGVYLYSYATDTTRASSEADHTLRMLEESGVSPADLSYPVYYDLEDDSVSSSVDNQTLADIATTFCDKIEAAGYTPGVYANKTWFTTYLTDSCFDQWTRWVAQYPSTGSTNAHTTYTGDYDMWQCMSSGSVDGIGTAVDIDFSYASWSSGMDIYGSHITYPGALRQGDSFSFSGTVRGTSPLTNVTGAIVDSNGTNVMSASVEPNAYYFRIADSDIDNTLVMSSLSEGRYRYVITASTASQTVTVFDQAFDVYTPAVVDTSTPIQLSSVANSSLVLDAAGSNPESGANVSAYTSNGGANQAWNLVAQGDGSYLIQSCANENLVLDASGSTPDSGANVTVYSSNGGDNQKWIFDEVDGGYLIRNAANTALVLDASGSVPESGANISAWTSNGGNNQKWNIVRANNISNAAITSSGMLHNATGTALSANVSVTLMGKSLTEGTDYQLLYENSTALPSAVGTYEVTVKGIGSYSGTAKVGTLEIVGCDLSATTDVHLVSRSDSSLVLDAAGNPPETGSNISVWSANGGDNQSWNLELGTDGFYVIRSVADSTLVLDAAGESPESGANISAWTENGGLNQRWVLSGSASEGYVITSAANPSLVLDAAGNPASSGSDVSAWTSNGGDNQKWNFATGYDLSLASVSSYGLTRNYLGAAVDLSNNVTVTMFGKELKAGTDYRLLYANSASAPAGPGTYEVTVEGIGSYSGTAKVGTLEIIGCDLASTSNVRLVSRANSLLVLDAAGNPPSTGSNISVWSANGGDNQSWNLELGTDGFYVIRSVADSTLVLDAAGESPESGANISAWTENGGLNQRWVISGSASEGYVIKSAANPSLVLDAADNPPSIGSNVSAWTSNGGDNQKWDLQ